MLTNTTHTAYFTKFQTNSYEGSAEVLDIILDSDHVDYNNPTDIGLIKFRFVNKLVISENSDIQYARPLNPYFKIYPIKTEIVNIFSYVSPSAQVYRNGSTYYYQTSVNTWNLLNLNSVPNSSKHVNEDQVSIDFDENEEIKNLQPFQGDVILSGRYGQFIRFGSSNSKFKNDWSKNSKDGNPITIITNTAKNIGDNYRLEDINEDECSIWLTSKQQIPIVPVSDNFKSFTKKPTTLRQYDGTQIIISSDRLAFLSKVDSIFLNAKKSISLSAIDSVNIDTKQHIINAETINLGTNATESAILGNKLVTDVLVPLITALTTIDTVATGGANITSISQITAKLNTILSKITKLK